ncbi:MAG: glycoside hydrolase family 127 protein [Oscillospiraceae bacterium]|nr:glycoside hydrolase family 127 protein [Oscillospiraceae bacterium]
MQKTAYIDYRELTFNDGFWKKRQQINRETTVKAVYDRFEETGRFGALSCLWKDGMPNEPHEYWDSDVAKWIEGVAYITARYKNEELEAVVDRLVGEIEKNALDCGYFNSYYLTHSPDERFTNRNNHELYCLGHFIEAAIAYKNATGKDKLLRLMQKYADYVVRVFLEEKSAGFFTPGHQEAELAFVKLYRETGDNRYLKLASYFIEERGRHDEKMFLPEYPAGPYPDIEFQSHKPVREQTEAVGHCVRALYMYCAMADLARENSDTELFDVCKKMFDDITGKKMYLTGGVGANRFGERFAYAYDLPNELAYSETCASISVMLFAKRMSEIDVSSKYADVIERVMYNAMLSGVSLDGKRFFYTNPLEIEPRHSNRHDMFEVPPTYQPIQQRVEVFRTSCCPPNIVRTLASIEQYFYSVSGDTVYAHQFAPCELVRGGVKIIQETDYPRNGSIKFTVSGDVERLAIRIPSWCESYTIDRDYVIDRGYAYIENPIGEINVFFDMTPFFVQANPDVTENGGRVALQRGPIVYCGEAATGTNLRNMRFTDNSFSERFDEKTGAVVLTAELECPEKTDDFGLYRRYKAYESAKEVEFIPYYAFANNGEKEMLIWFNI